MRGMRGVGWIVLAAAACHRSPAQVPVDATPGGMEYRLGVLDNHPRAVIPTLWIDGVETTEITVNYVSFADALAQNHHIEMRYQNTVVADLTLTEIDMQSCASEVSGRVLTHFQETLCAFDSGEFAYNSFAGGNTTSDCGIADGFCLLSGCPPCGAGEQCTARVTLANPMFSHLGCAPIGSQQLGDPCQLTNDPAGAYDNCGANLICVSGTCHATCLSTQTCATCASVDGFPRGIGICT